jgi:lysophospholipase L1-like esterase
MSNIARIICFGASTVYGRNDSQAGGFVGRLRGWHEPQHVKNLIYNLGIGGETIADMLLRLNHEVKIRNPELLIFYSGYNDIVRRDSKTADCACSLTDYKLACKNLFSQAKDLCPVLAILPLPFKEELTSPFGKLNWYYLISDAQKYIDAQAQVINSLAIDSIDLFNPQLSAPDDALISSDGLHPSSAGHQLIFEKIRDWLQQ